jgi:stage II sporulation protein D
MMDRRIERKMKHWKSLNREQWRDIVLSSLALLVVLILVLQARNWADQPPPSLNDTGSYPLPIPASSNKPAMLDADLIRVGISTNRMTELEYPSATISGTGQFKILGKFSGKTLYAGEPSQNITIVREDGRFDLLSGGHYLLGLIYEPLEVLPISPETRLRVTSVTRKGIIPSYRGIFEIVPGYSGSNRFTVVNVLPMQDYLKAVVPNELPIRYGYEAVKAQAIAARNYAIHPREKPWPQFDICDSQYCQAYYGSNTEQPQTTKALEETQGLVALYQGDPILALYSSSHGGYSENYENAFSDVKTERFPGTPLPYLKGAPDTGESWNLSKEADAAAFYSHPDPTSYDILSPYYRWRRHWTVWELESTINRNLSEAYEDTSTRPFIKPAFPKGCRIGTLKDIKVLERGVSGKVMRMAIEGSAGTWVIEKEFVVRKVFHTEGQFLPSANVIFTCDRDPHGEIREVEAYGGGFGHGVGMSQLGASFMSGHGKSFIEILQHYYHGVTIGTVPLFSKPDQGMKTTFYVSNPQGILYVQGGRTTPVILEINDHKLTVTPDATGKKAILVQSYLQANTLNTLKIYPTPDTTACVKAWLEIYPTLQMASQKSETPI